MEAMRAQGPAGLVGELRQLLRLKKASPDALVEALAGSLTDLELHEVVLGLQDRDQARSERSCAARVRAAREALARGDLPSARREVEAAVHLHFTDGEAQRTLAEVLERLGERARAHAHYALAFHFGADTRLVDDAVRRTGSSKGVAPAPRGA